MGAVRTIVGAALVGVCGCFTGTSAAGLPCENHDQCGTELRCEQGVCGGPSGTSNLDTTVSATSTESSTGGTGSSGTDPTSESGSSGDPQPACGPPPDPWVCTGTQARGSLAHAIYTFPDDDRSTAVTVGYYSGDGALDVAVGHHDSRRITILENTGTGSFSAPEAILEVEHNIAYMVASDLDCDGVHEFYTIGYQPELQWATFNGSLFQTQPPIPVAAGGFSLAVGDVVRDGDDRPELLVAFGQGTNRVDMFEGVSGAPALIAGVFGVAGAAPWEIIVMQSALGPRVLVADSNQNDYVTNSPFDHIVHVLAPTGRPDTVELEVDPMFSAVATDFQNPYAMAVGSFTAPGATQVAVAEKFIGAGFEESTEAGRVRVFDVTADGFEQVAELPVGIGPRAIAAADLDCDGLTDLVISNSGLADGPAPDGRLEIAFGGAGLQVEPMAVVDDLRGGSTRIGVGDFDGNGRPEAAVADWAGDRLIVFGFPD